jgi:hypothetical protein
LGRSTNSIESNTRALFDASREDVLETNAEKTEYCIYNSSIMKLFYMHNDLHVLANHMAIFRKVKYINKTCRRSMYIN